MTAPAVQTVYEACEEMLTRYTPVATRVEGHNRSIVIRAGGNSHTFYVLAQDLDDGTCHLFPWYTGLSRTTVITPGLDVRAVPKHAVQLLRHGVPVPQHGIAFGWVGRGDRVTALVPVDVEYRPDKPLPTFAVMPHEDAGRNDWPPFYNAEVFGPEMWEAQRAGRLVVLDDAIASTAQNVSWIERTDGEAASYCDVGTDVAWDGFTIPAGRYAYWRRLLSRDRRWPSPTELLDNYTASDLAPRFR
jgi:hypothetical protein